MRSIELSDEQVAIVHELVLRGLRETDPSDRRYGEAYDAFVKSAPLRIGDQPENVRNVWDEIVEDTTS